jgi:hypothetical protein
MQKIIFLGTWRFISAYLIHFAVIVCGSSDFSLICLLFDLVLEVM